MGCDFAVYLHPLTRDPLTVAQTAFREIEELEDLLTVYRSTSEVSRINQEASRRPVPVDERTFALLRRSAELYNETQGAFDVATGAIINAWGFAGGSRRVPGPEEHAAAMAASGMRHVELNESDRTVRYRVDGLQVNFGSIGKGFALDAAMRRLKLDFGTRCALITGGGSSMLATGSLWGDESGWLIGIEDPEHPDRTVARVRLRDRALGTSSSSNQFLEAGGRRYGHLLDPRTGRPADEVASASCLAADAATADALATAFFVMGLDKIAEFCQNHSDIAAIVVLKNGRCPGNVTTRAGRRGPADQAVVSKRLSRRVLSFNLAPQDVKVESGRSSA